MQGNVCFGVPLLPLFLFAFFISSPPTQLLPKMLQGSASSACTVNLKRRHMAAWQYPLVAARQLLPADFRENDDISPAQCRPGSG